MLTMVVDNDQGQLPSTISDDKESAPRTTSVDNKRGTLLRATYTAFSMLQLSVPIDTVN
jgi:hypothetical protein